MKTIPPITPPTMAPIGTLLPPDFWPTGMFGLELDPAPELVPELLELEVCEGNAFLLVPVFVVPAAPPASVVVTEKCQWTILCPGRVVGCLT